MKTILPGRVGLLVLFLALPLAATAGWELRQLTDCTGGVSENPAISADGRTVVFVSTCDLVSGENTDRNRELFRWRENEGLEQLTRTERCQNLEPSLEAKGLRIAFATTCSFPQANADQSLEIALLQSEGQIQLLTDTSGSANTRPALAPSGRWLAFLSNADPLGRNPDHSQQLFLLDLALPDRPLQQATAEERSVCQEPTLANAVVAAACDGRRGEENPEGNFEILAGSAAGALNPLTRTRDCENREPQLNPGGDLLLFRGNCNPLGQNLNRYHELFLVRGATGIEQVTRDLAEGAFQPSLSGNGSRAAFVSRWGREFQNPDHNPEVFILELNRPGPPEQVAETAQGGSYGPRLSADGRRLVFYANVNPRGANSDGSFEIFLAEENVSEEANPE